jgi:hypothetical protein
MALTARSVTELEAELEVARAEAEAKAKRQAAEAKATATRQRAVAAQGRARLAELEPELASVLAVAPDDNRVQLLKLRGPARQWLHGGSPQMASASLELADLCERDPVAGRLAQLHQALGLVLVSLGEAGLGEADELLVRADTAECASWRGLMARVRLLAGED